jgi:hypothetical protein
MLKSHFDAIEKHLLAISEIPSGSGHPLHKGTPREAFIAEFLRDHLSENVAIGSGEVIDAFSRPGDKRNQLDIVIYRRAYPKLDFGGGASGFLIESVASTIEVKSTLTKKGVYDAVAAARNVKSLTRHVSQVFSVGYQPPGVLSYLIAYGGPSDMKTVYEWVSDAHLKQDIQSPDLPPSLDARVRVPAPSLDAIFVLGKGFVYFDNMPLSFVSKAEREETPESIWVVSNTTEGNVLLLFAFLSVSVGGLSGALLNPFPYIERFSLKNVYRFRWTVDPDA